MTVCTGTSKRFLLSWSTEQMERIGRQKKQKVTPFQASLHSSSPPHTCTLKQWFLGCAGVRLCRFWSLHVCVSHMTSSPSAQDISYVPHSAFQWCLLSIWHMSALLSALFMPPGANSRIYHHGKSSTPSPTALGHRQKKKQTQIKPSNLLDTRSALPGVRILRTMFHEQKRAHLFNSYVWENFFSNCMAEDHVREETEVLLHTSRCIFSTCILTKAKPSRTENNIPGGCGLILAAETSPEGQE